MKLAHYIKHNNFTGLYRELMYDLLTGQVVKPRDQGTYELVNVNLILENPRNRL